MINLLQTSRSLSLCCPSVAKRCSINYAQRSSLIVAAALDALYNDSTASAVREDIIKISTLCKKVKMCSQKSTQTHTHTHTYATSKGNETTKILSNAKHYREGLLLFFGYLRSNASAGTCLCAWRGRKFQEKFS